MAAVKAIICTRTGSPEIFSFTHLWTRCPCGNVHVKWDDPDRGTVIVDAAYREDVRLLGLNNMLLVPALTTRGQAWEDFRAWHERATDAPNHVFDKSRAGCWAVIARIGTTSDVRWATPDEHLEALNEVAATAPQPAPGKRSPGGAHGTD